MSQPTPKEAASKEALWQALRAEMPTPKDFYSDSKHVTVRPPEATVPYKGRDIDGGGRWHGPKRRRK